MCLETLKKISPLYSLAQINEPNLYAQTDRVMITAPDLDLWNLTRKVHAHKKMVKKEPNNHQQNSKTSIIKIKMRAVKK